MPRLTDAAARPGHRIWLRHNDGVQGEVDLSGLAGHGVFEAWENAAAFESVRPEPHGAVAWGDQAELCPDALYLRLTKAPPLA